MPQSNDLLSSNHGLVLNDSDFAKMREIIHKSTGISIADNRRSMLVSRLQSRLRATGEKTFVSYISKISVDPVELQELINRVTTNETYFYRTPRVWSHLREVAILEHLNCAGARHIKVWSAAASTGEEAYSIGMALETIRRATPHFDYSVFGTDISSRVIDIGKAGVYTGRSISKFRSDHKLLFNEYMIGDDTAGYSVIPEVKMRVYFRLHNLIDELVAKGPFDIVFLRNVLIYFSKKDQETILENVRRCMRPRGILYIGESETLTNLNTAFSSVAPLVYRASNEFGVR